MDEGPQHASYSTSLHLRLSKQHAILLCYFEHTPAEVCPRSPPPVGDTLTREPDALTFVHRVTQIQVRAVRNLSTR